MFFLMENIWNLHVIVTGYWDGLIVPLFTASELFIMWGGGSTTSPSVVRPTH